MQNWNIPKFYKESISEFQKLNTVKIGNGRDVRQTILWYNDDILINKQPVFNRSMYLAGIVYVGDILRHDGTFLSYGELKQKYPDLRINCLSYQGIISTIPAAWKRLLRNVNRRELQIQNEVQCTFGDKIFPLIKLRSRHVYDRLMENKAKPTSEKKWEREGYYMNWNKVYEIPYGCTMSTRLQSLHYRVVHRYVPTLRFLHVRRIKDSPLCPTCNVEECLSHFMFDCKDVKPIWIKILTRLKYTFKLRNDFVQCKTVLFGYHRTKPVVNLIILLVKQQVVISKSKDVRTEIKTDHIKSGIMQYFNIEKQIAFHNNTMDKFLSKWDGVLADGDNIEFEKIM